LKKPSGTVLNVDIRFSGGKPLYRQLYMAVKGAILDGRLRPGARLPSTRIIAADFNMSRTTVLNAFDQLSAEGYLKARVGSGTTVAPFIPGDLGKRPRDRARPAPSSAALRIAERAHLDPFHDLSFLRRPSRPLRPGEPELALFPREIWSRLAAKHWRRANRDPEHIDSLGFRPLRQAISEHVGRLRAVRCDPDQVLITCGAQQALYLAASALLDPREPVWMEDPGYPRARAAFLSAGLRVIPVPVDSEGLAVSAGRNIEPNPRLVFVTPSFQCPLGTMMSLRRRFELLETAQEKNAWVLEDDYFGEYRHGASPTASLQSIDRNERVIHIGNFSKSIAPSLRIGYMILPPAVVNVMKDVRSTMSRQPPGVEQAILAEFITEGHLDRHLRTTLRVYRERQQALIAAIEENARGLLETVPGGTGMYLVAWLARGMDDQIAAEAAARRGVDTVPLSAFCRQPLNRKGLVLGYSAYEGNRIRKAIRELCAALSHMR